ncbi:MAG: 50S ribosomal protein L4 [Geobacteraceae bacterium]|nr:50S ribosomal protein L4 [Geobacteraceae bacterium]
MATIDLFDMKKNKIGVIDLNDSVFNAEIKEYLIHDAIRVQLTNRRAGTVSVKTRSQVAGSGKKPFRQKGTGGARQGCRRAPQYPGGGVAFGPQKKDYNLSMNKKAHKAAMKSCLSYLFKENKFTVLDSLTLDTISTKTFASFLSLFSQNKSLIVLDTMDKNIELSSRNIMNVKLLQPEGLNVYDLMKYKNVIFTESAMRKVEGALQS